MLTVTTSTRIYSIAACPIFDFFLAIIFSFNSAFSIRIESSMDSEAHSSKNLTLVLPQFGKVLIQPKYFSHEISSSIDLIVCPRPMTNLERDVIADWASFTQIPLYCTGQDVRRLCREGFDSYRFHRVFDYHKFQTPKGALEFLPIPKQKKVFFMSFLKKPEAFHVVFEPLGETPIIWLSDLDMSRDEAHVIRSLKVPILADRKHLSERTLHFASTLLDSPILCAEEFATEKRSKKHWKIENLKQVAPPGRTVEAEKRVGGG